MNEEFEVFNEYTDEQIEEMVLSELAVVKCASSADISGATGGTACCLNGVLCMNGSLGSCP